MLKIFHILEMVSKYLAAVITGIHAANMVEGATNQDKKAQVLATVTKVVDAVSEASGDPKVQLVGTMIDVAASVYNGLTQVVAAKAAAESK